MPAARLPVAKARAIGAHVKDPGRHKGRANPVVALIGAAPAHLTETQKRMWAQFVNELPWLAAPDAALLEVAVRVRASLADGEDVGVTKLSMYQSVLSKLGATPTDRSKVMAPDGGEQESDEFFN